MSVFRTGGDWMDWLEARRAVGLPMALATVIATWGSSPRPVGSHLWVDAQGEFAGSVSGGCIEAAVITAAREVIADARPQRLMFGVSDEQAWEVGLACGGAIEVFVDTLDAALADRLLAARHQRRTLVVVTRLSDGNKVLVDCEATSGDLPVTPAVLAVVQRRFKTGQSGILEEDDTLFVRVYAPQQRLMIVGAVHIAQVLAPMAALAGFDVAIIDPRRGFATAERFSATRLLNLWPDEALTQLDAATAVVTLSHDPKIDDPALLAALASPVFYVGALGSKRTHAKRIERLREAGYGEEVSRIHAPVGLDLGGRQPQEIAVAVLAEIVQARHR